MAGYRRDERGLCIFPTEGDASVPTLLHTAPPLRDRGMFARFIIESKGNICQEELHSEWFNEMPHNSSRD